MRDIRDMLVHVGKRAFVFRGNHQQWLEEALRKTLFRGKTYLRYAQHGSYNRLWELSRVVDEVQRLRKELDLEVRECRVLDVGCGRGNITVPLASLGYDVTAIDVDRSAASSIEKWEKGLDNIRFFRSDALEYIKGYQGEPFHVVICSHVLEHLEKPESLCRAVRQILCKKGIIVILIPNPLGLAELLFERPAFVKRILGVKFIPGRDHVQSLTLRRTRTLISACGLRLKSITPVASVVSPFLGQSHFALLELRLTLPPVLAWSWVVTVENE